MSQREQLIALVQQRSFQYSREPVFTLASGRKSCFYFNLKAVTYYPQSLVLIGRLIYDRIHELGLAPAGIGGLTMGADPIAISVAYTSALAGNPIEAFSVRKEPKAHGLRLPIEGCIQPGARVVIVEDVVTTGGSTIKAVSAARDYGLEIAGVIALLDRCEQNGRENIEACGVDVSAILDIHDFIPAGD
ncbi:MAG TPA: orotate phosphoribosyltransferase [Desulfosalsimonadaceae bacterium]|nr:orotate phosphoribosyltransferase [Desulfosalsimonadaceae bacterium]